MSTENANLPGDDAAAQPLSSREVDLALRELRGWSRQEGGLYRRFRRQSFMDAIQFVNEVARLAEAASHHPNIDIRYRNVIIFLTTHEAGGITNLDLQLAGQISALES